MRDVRMQGFAERADVEEVERFLVDHEQQTSKVAADADVVEASRERRGNRRVSPGRRFWAVLYARVTRIEVIRTAAGADEGRVHSFARNYLK